jgi:hypothetical protein
MTIHDELQILLLLAIPILLTRIGMRACQRQLKALAIVLSVVSLIAICVSFRLADRDAYRIAILLSIGLVCGALDVWRAVWKQNAKDPWTRG